MTAGQRSPNCGACGCWHDPSAEGLGLQACPAASRRRIRELEAEVAALRANLGLAA